MGTHVVVTHCHSLSIRSHLGSWQPPSSSEEETPAADPALEVAMAESPSSEDETPAARPALEVAIEETPGSEEETPAARPALEVPMLETPSSEDETPVAGPALQVAMQPPPSSEEDTPAARPAEEVAMEETPAAGPAAASSSSSADPLPGASARSGARTAEELDALKALLVAAELHKPSRPVRVPPRHKSAPPRLLPLPIAAGLVARPGPGTAWTIPAGLIAPASIAVPPPEAAACSSSSAELMPVRYSGEPLTLATADSSL